MNYESWRATFQSSEQAAKAAFQELKDVRAPRDEPVTDRFIYKNVDIFEPDEGFEIYEKGYPFVVGTACNEEVAKALCCHSTAQNKDHWIRCSDTLPPDRKPVIIWCEGSGCSGYAHYSYEKDSWMMPEPQPAGYNHISHWMPLPGAPEEVSGHE